MTKTKFVKLRYKCPWFYIDTHEPKCSAHAGQYRTLHCAIKNCAILYWKGVENEINTNSTPIKTSSRI